jgi:hypothetical protein
MDLILTPSKLFEGIKKIIFSPFRLVSDVIIGFSLRLPCAFHVAQLSNMHGGPYVLMEETGHRYLIEGLRGC